jgi:MFS family permease
MFPGAFYLLAMWYRREESQKRYTFFFSSTTLAGAFGGLLASAIGKMDYVRGYRGWRWVFILGERVRSRDWHLGGLTDPQRAS